MGFVSFASEDRSDGGGCVIGVLRYPELTQLRLVDICAFIDILVTFPSSEVWIVVVKRSIGHGKTVL